MPKRGGLTLDTELSRSTSLHQYSHVFSLLMQYSSAICPHGVQTPVAANLILALSDGDKSEFSSKALTLSNACHTVKVVPNYIFFGTMISSLLRIR